MYKIFVLAALLFPQLASAHGEHAPVDSELTHGLVHAFSRGWGIITGFVLLALFVAVGASLRRSRTTEKE